MDTPKFTRAIEANKNAIMAKFCAKLLPAKILPALEKGAKYWIVAFSGTMNNPPKNPNANEQTAAVHTPLAAPKNKIESEIPSAPIGTMPCSM